MKKQVSKEVAVQIVTALKGGRYNIEPVNEGEIPWDIINGELRELNYNPRDINCYALLTIDGIEEEIAQYTEDNCLELLVKYYDEDGSDIIRDVFSDYDFDTEMRNILDSAFYNARFESLVSFVEDCGYELDERLSDWNNMYTMVLRETGKPVKKTREDAEYWAERYLAESGPGMQLYVDFRFEPKAKVA